MIIFGIIALSLAIINTTMAFIFATKVKDNLLKIVLPYSAIFILLVGISAFLFELNSTFLGINTLYYAEATTLLAFTIHILTIVRFFMRTKKQTL